MSKLQVVVKVPWLQKSTLPAALITIHAAVKPYIVNCVYRLKCYSHTNLHTSSK
jgi:hypothetical protein